ncbi:MAG: flavodoxin family protein [Euryarchaeota archaeon]|nr:flavodoxin family protein [Euryarchaeota archaeon]
MKQPKIIGFGGSPRKNGNTDVILNAILRGARSCGADTEMILLRDQDIHSCVGCEQCRKDLTCTRFDDDMQQLYPKIEEASGLVLGSPTYNYNVTSMVKAFIDRLYCYYDFTDDRPRQYSSRLAGQGRKAVVFAVCEQEDIEDMGFTLEAMGKPLNALAYDIVEELPVIGYFDRGIVAEDKDVLQSAFEAGQRLAKELK